jgi:hypothetical protein
MAMTPLAAQTILISAGVGSVLLLLIGVMALLSLARIHRLRRQTAAVSESLDRRTESLVYSHARQPKAVREHTPASQHMRRVPALRNTHAQRLLAFLKAELIYAEKPS